LPEGEFDCPVCDSFVWREIYVRVGWTFMRCSGCGLVRLDPLPSEAQLVAHYARRAQAGGNYDLARAANRDANLVAVLDFLAEVTPGPGTVLDVGCFDGRLLELAAGRDWDVFGIEPQEEAAAVAERHHPGRIEHAALERSVRWEPRAFDAITAISVLEHLRDPKALFELARRCLRPGGVLVVHTPDRRSLPARLLGRYWPPIAPPEHTFYFDRRTLRSMSRRYGFAEAGMRRDVKWLRPQYVYDQFQFFGPEFHRLLAPLMRVLPRRLKNRPLPFYVGEIFLAARLPPNARDVRAASGGRSPRPEEDESGAS
jgi:SAM-dependent methyltransferase